MRIGGDLVRDVAKFRLSRESRCEVLRVESPHVFGDAVDLFRGKAEGRTSVTHRPAGTVGRLHRQQRDPMMPVPVEHGLIDVVPARGLDVDIDIGQGQARISEKSLSEQVVL